MDKKTKSVLVVEEQAIIASDISRLIQKWGFQSGGVAFKIEAARKIANKEKPNLGLVVLDSGLVGSFDFGAEMGKAGVGILYLATSAEHLESMTHIGSEGYVRKPIPEDVLKTKIEDFYKNH